MRVILASRCGLCFGVRDAVRLAARLARQRPVTVLGELAHNRAVRARLARLGAFEGRLEPPGGAPTPDVIVTAHGASDRVKEAWRRAGFRLTDLTCPLVRRAHRRLAELVAAGCFPVVIGRADHAEVRGLLGDHPAGRAVLSAEDVAALPRAARYGVIAQTTQPSGRVAELVEAIRRARPDAEVRHVDTVCRATEDRRLAVEELCGRVSTVVVVGGAGSNNTRELARAVEARSARAFLVEDAAGLRPEWFDGVREVGVTAGTSTPDESIVEVVHWLERLPAPAVARG